MTTIAFILLAIYFVTAFLLRLWVQYRRTGDTGFRGISGRPDSAEWWAGVLFILAVVVLAAVPVADVMGLQPVDALVDHGVQVSGVFVAAGGIIATVVTQLAMGASWRIGVAAEERTELVTDGMFGVVRNPIYTDMVTAALGVAMVVPNVVAIAAVVLLVVALELQVRVVEEPHLARVHGDAWDAYAARVGRFIPWTGRQRQPRRPAPR